MKLLTRVFLIFSTVFVFMTAVYADRVYYTLYAVEGGNIYFNAYLGSIERCDSGVTRAVIPAEIDGTAVTSIDSLAFRNCDSLTSVEIPASVTSIENDTFSNCGALTNISVDSGHQQYASAGGVLFNKSQTVLIRYPCGKQEESYQIPSGVTSIGNRAFSRCNSLTRMEIPVGVTSIGDSAFSGCDGLTSVEIPASVTSIGGGAFSCGRLRNISVDNGNPQYTSVGGVVFNKGQTALICYPRGKWEASYQIPTSVTSIGDSAFSGCNLSGVEIPDSVTSIGNHAFSGCDALTSVEIPASVTSIEDHVFSMCYSLTSMKIPASVTSIGMQAFSWCDSLTSVEIPDSVTSIGNRAFDGCDSLRDVYYGGNREQWDAISGISHSALLSDSISIHYNASMPSAPAFAVKFAPTVNGYVIAKEDLPGLSEISVPLSVSIDAPGQVTLCVPFFGGGKFLGMGFAATAVDNTTQSVAVPVTGDVSGAETLKVIFVDADFCPLSVTGFDIQD